MRIVLANRTALGAALALSALGMMGFLTANRYGAAAVLLAIAGSALAAILIHRETVARQRAENALRRASGALEHRVAERTAELNNVNVALHVEILERHRTEEQLRRTRDQLESRVTERTLEVERANRDLVRINGEIQSFYHTLSHELKTPLTAAREFISIVMDGLGGPLNATQSDYLRIALDSCDQLRVCLNDLLDATRLETGKLSIDRRPGALDLLVQRVVTTLASAARARDITMRCTAAPDLPPALFDEARIRQVLTNLLNNAFKFTARGGSVSVHVESCPKDRNALQVSVRDSGRGIPREQLGQIFDRLYQIRSGDAAGDGGIGLGLYICRELVRLHGGEIIVESEVGQGSVFTFTLPGEARPAAVVQLSPPLFRGATRRGESPAPQPGEFLVGNS